MSRCIEKLHRWHWKTFNRNKPWGKWVSRTWPSVSLKVQRWCTSASYLGTGKRICLNTGKVTVVLRECSFSVWQHMLLWFSTTCHSIYSIHNDWLTPVLWALTSSLKCYWWLKLLQRYLNLLRDLWIASNDSWPICTHVQSSGSQSLGWQSYTKGSRDEDRKTEREAQSTTGQIRYGSALTA